MKSFNKTRNTKIKFGSLVLMLALLFSLSMPSMAQVITVKGKGKNAMSISVKGATLISESGRNYIYEVEQGGTAIITCSRQSGSKEYSIEINTTTYDLSDAHFGRKDEYAKNKSAQYKIEVPAGKTKQIPNGVGRYVADIHYGTPDDNSIDAELVFKVVKKKTVLKAPAAGSYKGTMTRLGSKMEYSFSGGTVTSKRGVKYTENDESDMSVYWAGEVAAGSTVTASCKKLEGRKNYNDVKVEIYATTKSGKTKEIQEKKGAGAASASGIVPNDAQKVTLKMNYTGRLGRLYCFVNFDVVKNASPSTSDSFKWNDVGALDRCPKCNGQFSKYYVNEFVGDVYVICNGAPKEFKRKLDSGHGKLVPIYYNDYIYTGSEDWVSLDYGDEDGVLKILGNSKILLMNKLPNGNPQWVINKGKIVGKSTNRACEPEFKMSQCTAKPTGTTYVLEDDGKTSRVSLLEGSMEVVSNKGSKKQTLRPGQVVTVISNGQMKVDNFDVSATAKKYGILGLAKTAGSSTQNSNNQNSSAASTARTEKFSVKGVSFKMVRVDGGTFTMGATKEQGSNNSNQRPVHKVTLSTYYIGQTEVTQELWQAVMGSNPSKFKGSNLPVENVSWNECQQFISKLNKITGRKFRLPTEAEWEFAARGGNASRGYKFAGSNDPNAVAWHEGNSGKKTHAVGTKNPNELGLYDMSGNVWEWCQDWYGSYSSSAQTNPKGASSGTDHLNRGGAWCHESQFSFVAFRGSSGKPDRKVDNLGLRLVLVS